MIGYRSIATAKDVRKRWLWSRTVWFNWGVFVACVSVSLMEDLNRLPPFPDSFVLVAAGIVAIINIGLRLLTGKALRW
jgi:hypothetical protein